MRSKVKSGQFEVKVQIVPTDGKSTTKSTTIPATGASLREVLKALNIDPKNKNITVNGTAADLDRHVTPEDVVKANAVVQVTERPAGS
jgi:hypothetical protein